MKLIQDNNLTLSLIAAALCLLVGCADLPVGVEAPPVAVAPSSPSAQSAIKVHREPGSLWSEDSPWNDLYQPVAGHSVGDIIVVKLEDAIRQKIVKRLQPPETKKEEPTPEEKKKAAQAGAKPGAELAGDRTIKASIRQIKPKGIYVLGAADLIKIGEFEPYITLEGQVRERDIDAQDTVGFDIIQNPKLSVLTQPPKEADPKL